MNKLILTTTALLTLGVPAMADDGLPRGWQGALEMYSCQPDEWFRNSQGIWQNPTCISVSGGGNPEPMAVLPDEDDEDEDED
jgi:hypothetical protein